MAVDLGVLVHFKSQSWTSDLYFRTYFMKVVSLKHVIMMSFGFFMILS